MVHTLGPEKTHLKLEQLRTLGKGASHIVSVIDKFYGMEKVYYSFSNKKDKKLFKTLGEKLKRYKEMAQV